ncbi:MAG: cobalt ECF transporter T component CbiQ [Tannerellaceae bacterium]
MESKLESAYRKIKQLEIQHQHPGLLNTINPVAKVITTLIYLVLMLSVSVYQLSVLLPFAVYPILLATFAHISFRRVCYYTLPILPFVVLIALFNPILDRQTAFTILGFEVSQGWISFASIITRAILAVQSVMILLLSTGMIQLTKTMHRIGIPSILTNQILFVYRYLIVILEEAIAMQRARQSRGCNEKNIRIWSTIIGQLFLRSMNRSTSIYQAMLSRGYSHTTTIKSDYSWHVRDSYFMMLWISFFLFIRFFNPTELLLH